MNWIRAAALLALVTIGSPLGCPALAQRYDEVERLRSITVDDNPYYHRLEDNTVLTARAKSDTVHVYDLGSGEVKRTINNACGTEYADSSIYNIAARGNTLMLGCAHVVEGADAYFVRGVALDRPEQLIFQVKDVAFAGLSFDGRRLAYLDAGGDKIGLLEIGRTPRTLALKGFDRGAVFNFPLFLADNDSLLLRYGPSSEYDDDIATYSFARGSRIGDFKETSAMRFLERATNGKTVVIAYQSSVKAYDPQSGAVRWSREADAPTTVIVTPDNNRVLVMSEYNTRVLDLSTGKDLATLGTPYTEFSIDGRYALALEDGELVVYGSDTENVFLAPLRSFVVQTTPNAALLMNSIPVGRSDERGRAELNVPEGPQWLTVRAAGFNTVSKSIDVTAVQRQALELPLERAVARLSFESTPSGATVILDGKDIGVTPLTVPNAGFQPYSYALRLEDYLESTGTVTPSEDAPNAVSRIALVSAPLLEFSSSPSGAEVFVGGKLLGVTPLTVRGLPSGQLEYSLKKTGFQSFTGSAKLAAQGRVPVNVTLEAQNNDPPLPSAAQLPSLGFNRNALERARSELREINRVPVLRLETMAALLGVGVYGDNRRVQLQQGSRRLELPLRDPARNTAFAYLLNGFYYAPLSALATLGIRTQRNSSGYALLLEDDRVDLGLSKAQFWTQTFLDDLAQQWRPAVTRSVRVDDQPAFAVRDLVGLLSGVSYDAQSGKLYRDGALVAKLFVRPAGYAQRLVWISGNVYVPAGLLPLLEASAKVSAGTVALKIGGAPVTLNYSAAGRISTTTAVAQRNYESQLKRIEADRQAEVQRIQQRRADIERVLSRTIQRGLREQPALKKAVLDRNAVYKHLGNDLFGTVVPLKVDGDPFVLSFITFAVSPAQETWVSCLFLSPPGYALVSWGVSAGRVKLTVQGPYYRETVYISYASGSCDVSQ